MTAYGREGDEFTLAAAGDAILTRRLSRSAYPGLDTLRDRFRSADAGFANLEVLLHDYEHPPAATSGGTYMRAPPAVLDDLEWLGVDLLAAANNHTGDFGLGGMRETMAALDARGWTYAGLGEHLAAARAPSYLDTPAGRVALVACCSTIVGGAEAGAQRPDLEGRPGLAPLRLETRHLVPRSTIDQLETLSERLGLEAEKARLEGLGFPYPGEDVDGFTFANVGGEDLHFEATDPDADEGTPAHRIERRIADGDDDALLEQVRVARRQADWVVVSVHAHEGSGPRMNDPSVPAFLEGFARDAIETGADVVLGHGPHVLRGVEVYEGAPICYSLGDFVMGNETIPRLPPELYRRYDLDPQAATPADLFDARTHRGGEPGAERIGFVGERDFYESVIAVPQWDEGEFDRMELHPIELGFEAPRPQRGRPRPADEPRGAAILDRLGERSTAYGTDLRIEDGVGVVTG